MSVNHDKVFVVTFAGVLAFLIGLTAVIYFVAGAIQTKALDDSENPVRQARLEERIKPVGQVNTDPDAAVAMPAADEGAEDKTAEQIVNDVCAACHDTGLLEAPKVGDKAAWSERLAKGRDTVIANAIDGLNAMPPKGGSPGLTDEQVTEAVEWMLNESGL